jgi:hypothetical protein
MMSSSSAIAEVNTGASESLRRENLARMTLWIATTRATALARPDPDAFLADWCDWLGLRMSDLGGDDCNRSLRGLTAFDLGEAQIALMRPLAAEAA